MIQKINADVEKILALMMRVKQYKSKINAPEFSHGEMGILHILCHNKDNIKEISPSYISDQLNVKRPTITSGLNSLESKGYIKRENIYGDRRKTNIIITDDGKNFLEKQFMLLHDMLLYLIVHLGQEKSQLLLNLAEECLNILENRKI